MCLKRKPPPKDCEIGTAEMQTKIRLVSIDKLHACEAQVLTKTKMVQRMAKLLGTAIQIGEMPDDWTRTAKSLVEQADSVKPEVLVIDYDEVDGIKEERTEAI